MTDKLRVLLAQRDSATCERTLEQLQRIEGLDVVGFAYDGSQALHEAIRLAPDLAILDVDLRSLDGLSAAARLKGTAAVVIVSSSPDHAIAAFDADAIDFLLDPIEPDRLMRSIDRARLRHEERRALRLQSAEAVVKTRPIVLPDRYGEQKLDPATIMLIKADRDYLHIHTTAETYFVRATMEAVGKQAPPYLVRVHRSSFVSLRAVRRWCRRDQRGFALMLHDGTTVPVGATYLNNTRELLPGLPTACARVLSESRRALPECALDATNT